MVGARHLACRARRAGGVVVPCRCQEKGSLSDAGPRYLQGFGQHTCRVQQRGIGGSRAYKGRPVRGPGAGFRPHAQREGRRGSVACPQLHCSRNA